MGTKSFSRDALMKIFHCDHCNNLVFFENSECVSCKHKLAYLPDVQDMGSLEPAGNNHWHALAAPRQRQLYRLCHNYSTNNICNWAVPAEDSSIYCVSCRLTRVIPNLGVTGNQQAWFRLEVAKRRLIYTLTCLGLPMGGTGSPDDPGLVFKFLADVEGPSPKPVMTGHLNGVITINIAEADDALREKRRALMHEPYRTLLGHFRHEVGHYYWDRLIRNSNQIHGFRNLFGDERADYGQALKTYYANGPLPYWQDQYVTAYCSSHPWEDWAETWAHYLHIIDTLETARESGLSLRPKRSDEPSLNPNLAMDGCQPRSFDEMSASWFSLTFILNNLNRGMGLPDGYPFVLPTPALEKLRYVHDVVRAARKPVAVEMELVNQA
jgi:hypothetical protein